MIHMLLGLTYSGNQLVGPFDCLSDALEHAIGTELGAVQLVPSRVFGNNRWPGLHLAVAKETLAGFPGPSVVDVAPGDNNLQVDKVMCAFASRLGRTMELLGYLVVQRHEWGWPWARQTNPLEESSDILSKAVFDFVGVANLIMSNLEANREPGLPVVGKLNLERLHHVVRG